MTKSVTKGSSLVGEMTTSLMNCRYHAGVSRITGIPEYMGASQFIDLVQLAVTGYLVQPPANTDYRPACLTCPHATRSHASLYCFALSCSSRDGVGSNASNKMIGGPIAGILVQFLAHSTCQSDM